MLFRATFEMGKGLWREDTVVVKRDILAGLLCCPKPVYLSPVYSHVAMTIASCKI